MTHASLFSGIGGPEVAAAMLGWDNVFHCEINPFGRQVLEYWFPNSDSYEDITKTDFTKYRGQIDVLTGGFPCQPFSYAGKRGGQADDRYLWPEMLRVIDEVRPTWVVGENVAGITTMVESCEITDMGGETSLFEEDNGLHRFRSEHTFTIERICRDLESKGYSVQPMLIPACAVGAPHRRDRVFIIAYSASCRSESYSQNGGAQGNRGGKYAQQGKWSEQAEFNNGFLDLSRNAADTDCWGRSEVDEHLQSKLSDGAEPFRDGGKRNVADTQNLFINGSETRYRGNDLKKKVSEPGSGNSQDVADSTGKQSKRCGIGKGSLSEKQEQLRGIDSESIARMLPGERWKGFPSVSPVHRGNDGLPFDVDNLAISFARWRNESLKAYGNAIVPQVMYRIFQHIEKLTLFRYDYNKGNAVQDTAPFQSGW